ncbi:response regulator transcription factor [Crystallibacter degradans]|uniref:response regulator transcription factor n=1 Tax=Crystallibacter degradans TaxID=2726743 RepID=UPI001474572D|nr:response regulator transcription factor [Arthrobacter sp. SF27]NMR32186.1 response regulator transcription factor [Arthrobacter sp. SF27]
MSVVRAGRVLVVEDEVTLARVVEKYLRKFGLEVSVCHDGANAVEAVRAFTPDVLVLDLGLPGMDGIEVCRRVRTFSDCHVLMLTARDDEVDKVVGLSVGADDYMTKPFSQRELLARVQARLRRIHQLDSAPRVEPTSGDRTVTIGDLVVDRAARQVHVDGEPVPFTRIEFDLLTALAEHPLQVLSRRQLVDMIWNAHWNGDEHLVDVHIGRIRKKLSDPAAAPRFIHTARGVGYRMGDGR